MVATQHSRMIEHEGRKAILAEIHARPYLPVEAPRRIYHFAFATDDEDARNDRKAIADICARNRATKPPEDAKFHYVQLMDWDLRWEQHTEFTTYTWSTTLDPSRSSWHRGARLSRARCSCGRNASGANRGRTFSQKSRGIVQCAEPLHYRRSERRGAHPHGFQSRPLWVHAPPY
jgi:uncharacterized membrane-anchored protein